MPKRRHPTLPRRHYLRPILIFVYILLIVYGSLYPWKGWSLPNGDHWWSLFEGKTRYFTASDIVVNILLYIPVGLSLFIILRERFTPRFAGWTALGLGAALSGCMEFLQLFMPARIASLRDFALNSLGTALGVGVAGLLGPQTGWGRHLVEWRQREFHSGRFTDFGLLVIGIWTLAQLSPFFPDSRGATLGNGLASLWQGLIHPFSLDIRLILSATFQYAGLGIVVCMLWRGRQQTRPIVLFGIFIFLVLLLKIPVLHLKLAAETLLGLSLALIILRLSLNYPPRVLAILGIIGLILGYVLTHFGPHKQSALFAQAINWMPFRYQIQGDARGLAILLDGLWPFMGAAFCALCIPQLRNALAAIGGGVIVFAISLGLEWWQQWDIAQRADITDVLLALSGWVIAWMHPVVRQGPR